MFFIDSEWPIVTLDDKDTTHSHDDLYLSVIRSVTKTVNHWDVNVYHQLWPVATITPETGDGSEDISTMLCGSFTNDECNLKLLYIYYWSKPLISHQSSDGCWRKKWERASFRQVCTGSPKLRHFTPIQYHPKLVDGLNKRFHCAAAIEMNDRVQPLHVFLSWFAWHHVSHLFVYLFVYFFVCLFVNYFSINVSSIATFGTQSDFNHFWDDHRPTTNRYEVSNTLLST